MCEPREAEPLRDAKAYNVAGPDKNNPIANYHAYSEQWTKRGCMK